MTPKQKKLLAQAAVLKRQAKKLGIEIRERDVGWVRKRRERQEAVK